MGRVRAVKTRQVAQVAPFHHLTLQDDPSAPTLMFYEVKSMVLGLQNAFWRSKRVLEQLYHFGTQKVCAWQGLRRGGRCDNIIGELLAPKCTLEHLGTHWGPSRPASRLWPWPVATALGLGRAGAEEGWGWAGQGLRRATGQPQPPSQPRSQTPSAATPAAPPPHSYHRRWVFWYMCDFGQIQSLRNEELYLP